MKILVPEDLFQEALSFRVHFTIFFSRPGPGLQNHQKLPGLPTGQHKKATRVIAPPQPPAAHLPGMASVQFLLVQPASP